MIYRHSFLVKARLNRVVEFHRRAESMSAITPPPIVVQMQRAPAVLAAGDEMEFTLWLGPLPIHWLARIEAFSENGFTDRQQAGPFAVWLHRHSFAAVDEQTTEVIDQITLQFRRHPLWGPVGIGMWLGLPLLFAFRAWKTKRMIQ